MSITEKFEQLPKLLKIFMIFCLPTSILYRVAKYTETKNTVTLVTAIVCCVLPLISLIMLVIDIIFEAKDNKIGLLVD